ncbi:MAG TPA: glycosyltransferase family 4 protein [Bacteroidota bacterium]|nr:glycosyltransferase family 4 protein [Bacteroidota bacterium]
MRVTMAGYQAVSILHGGPSTQIRNTAKYLPKFGVDVRFFDPWTPLRKTDTDIFHLFAANIGTFHLAREIHALGIPLVVSPIVFSLHSPAFVRRALRLGRLLQRGGKGIWLDYGLTSDICSWASRVLPNTEAEGKLASEGLGVDPGRIRIVPNGVDERFYTADPTPFIEKYGVRDFILNVGHTGHVRKNVLALIQALSTVDRPSVIIGRFIAGAYGDACRREAAKHRHILLIDGLDHTSDMLASAYAACDTFVLPSQFETPGIAALEAALAGAKVVITPYGGTKEYFGDLATYVEPASVNSIREGVLSALARPKGTELRERVRKNYLWQTVARMTADAYGEVAGQGS